VRFQLCTAATSNSSARVSARNLISQGQGGRTSRVGRDSLLWWRCRRSRRASLVTPGATIRWRQVRGRTWKVRGDVEKDGRVLRQSGCIVDLLTKSQHLRNGKKKRTNSCEQRQQRLFRKTHGEGTETAARAKKGASGLLQNRGTSPGERYQRVALALCPLFMALCIVKPCQRTPPPRICSCYLPEVVHACTILGSRRRNNRPSRG